MNKINSKKVTGIILELIAEIANRKKENIFLKLKLRGDILRFTEEVIRGLASKLNDEFKAQELKLTPDIVQPSEIVEDLVNLVWDKIPHKFKSPGS